MKLKELLLSTDFDALIPALKKEGYLAIRQYREAYDILCHLTPADESEIKNPKIRVEWVKPIEGYEDEDPYINVYNCEGDLWECNVAKEVIVDDACRLTKEEVIAKILWSCTFYGYTPQTRQDTFEDRIEHKMHTCYGTMARKLKQKYYLYYLPGHKKREILKTMRLASLDSISMSMEDWNYCKKRIAKASNIRKKRDYRMQKRIDYLDYREKYEGLRDKFMGGKDITFHDMDFIYDGFSMLLTNMETHTYGESSRVDYLKKLIKYIEMDSDYEFFNPQKLVVLCKVPSQHPLSSDEKEEIRNEFHKLAEKEKLIFGLSEIKTEVADIHFTILIQKYEKGLIIDVNDLICAIP
jgi:hypothetical protein